MGYKSNGTPIHMVRPSLCHISMSSLLSQSCLLCYHKLIFILSLSYLSLLLDIDLALDLDFFPRYPIVLLLIAQLRWKAVVAFISTKQDFFEILRRGGHSSLFVFQHTRTLTLYLRFPLHLCRLPPPLLLGGLGPKKWHLKFVSPPAPLSVTYPAYMCYLVEAQIIPMIFLTHSFEQLQ